ncbi:hypothetical protein [Micromonospora chalcea]|uniref:hypothetical protein n=1 Tax=Micromonospora chalcea TaxID=1874 RepID=UPI003F4A7F77
MIDSLPHDLRAGFAEDDAAVWAAIDAEGYAELRAQERAQVAPPQEQPPLDADDIWDHRPSLAHIRDAARAGRAGPYAVLGAVLARVIAATPPTVVLPKGVGGYGSLNLYVALVGRSGQGKGTAQRIAAEIIPDDGYTEAGIGSGEGIAHLYVRRTRANSAGGGDVEQHTTSALIDVPEIDTMTALGSRQGATLLPELRKAWVGEALGFAYADPSKRLPLRGHTYRLALIAGVQPGRGGTLLGDADGGTPQRFLWLPVIDPDAPDTQPSEPAPWEWKPPRWPGCGQRTILPLCDTAKAEVDADRLVRLRGHTSTDDLDAHALLARLKVAAALAILDGRAAVIDDDWSIAAAVMAISARTRAGIAAELRRAASQRNKERGAMEAERAVVVAERTGEADTRRVCQTITRKLADAGKDGLSRSELRRTIAQRDRDHLDEALDRLTAVGEIRADAAGGGQQGQRYRLTRAAQ